MQNGVNKVKYINHCQITDRMMTTQENKLRTLAFRHNRILRNFLMPIGVWPGEVLQDKTPLFSRIHRKFMFLMHTVMLAGQINYVEQNFGRISFFSLGQVYITLFMTCLVRDVILCLKAHGKLVYFFYTTFDLDHFKHKGPNYEKMSATVYKVSYYYAHIVTVMMLNGMVLYNALPMYNNYKSGVFTNNLVENATLEFSVSYLFPGFRQDDYFWISTLTNFYLTYLISIPMCIFDLFLYFLVFHIIGHLNVLMNNIKDIGKVRSQHRQNSDKGTDIAVQLYDNEENAVINTKITECINYHKFIIKFTDDVISLYGPVLAGSYLFHLISCCLLLLECSQLDPGALMQYGPLTIIIFVQLIQISVIFELIRTESDKLSDVVYSVPWESMDVKNQRSLCIFLHRVQTPVNVCALGLAEVGIQTMAGILKTTFTYFTFLKSIA